MARLKPRKGTKRQADFASGSDSDAGALVSNEVSSQPVQQQDEANDHHMPHAGQSYAAVDYPYQSSHQQQQNDLPAALPRTRARKRKPSGPASAVTPESDSTAAGRSSKRTRRGGSSGRGLYAEPSEDESNYDWASSESDEQQSEGQCITRRNGTRMLWLIACSAVQHMGYTCSNPSSSTTRSILC